MRFAARWLGAALVLLAGCESDEPRPRPAPSAGTGACGAASLRAFPNTTPAWARDADPDLAVDGAGGLFLAVEVKGEADLGGGALVASAEGGVAIAKFGPDGAHVWSRLLSERGLVADVRIAADGAGGAIVSGFFEGEIDLGAGALSTPASSLGLFLARLDASGKTAWSRAFTASARVHALGLAVEPVSGEIVLSGHATGASPDFGGGALPASVSGLAYVARFDALGSHLWSKAFSGDAPGRAGAPRVAGVALEPGGGLVVAGDFEGKLDLGGGALESAGDRDVFVARLDGAGRHVASARYGDAERQVASAVAASPSGGFVLCGALRGGADFGGGKLDAGESSEAPYVAVFSASGAHGFSRALSPGGSRFARGRASDCALDAAGRALVAGAFSGTLDLGARRLEAGEGDDADAFLVAFEPSGALACATSGGDAAWQRASSIAVAPSGAVIVAGALGGALAWRGASAKGAHEQDVFVGRFGP